MLNHILSGVFHKSFKLIFGVLIQFIEIISTDQMT